MQTLDLPPLAGQKIMVYDLEIAEEIKNLDRGWADHEGMGISCLCAYDYFDQRFWVAVTPDEVADWAARVEGPDWTLAGFNSISFDNKVLGAFEQKNFAREWEPKGPHFDLLREIWGAIPKGRPRKGYKLSQMISANDIPGANKLTEGALAPILFKRGQLGKLIEYCLHDVVLTMRLLEKAYYGRRLNDPNLHEGNMAIDLSKAIEAVFINREARDPISFR